LLSDYKAAIVSMNVADTRHELEQYLPLPFTDSHLTFICSQSLLRVLQVNECFQCVVLSIAVECSLRHLINCCVSSTIKIM